MDLDRIKKEEDLMLPDYALNTRKVLNHGSYIESLDIPSTLKLKAFYRKYNAPVNRFSKN